MAGKKIVIVGEAYDPTLGVGWPLPPVQGPVDPDYGIPIGGRPSHPIVIPPGSLGPGVPAHPIVLPPPPTPAHPIVIPPGYIDGVHPEHPIVIPPGEPVFPAHPWVPPDDSGNRPAHPIFLPVYPAHPIVIPPGAIDGVHPEHPIVIPPKPPGTPAHPIVLPPDQPPKPIDNWDVVTYWTADGGWGVAIIPSESHPGVPTPSKGSR